MGRKSEGGIENRKLRTYRCRISLDLFLNNGLAAESPSPYRSLFVGNAVPFHS